MGRDYIGERTIADPRMRAAEQARRRRLAAQRRAAEAAALARYKERARWCRVPGCGQPSAGGVFGFWPCCSEACMQRWSLATQACEITCLAGLRYTEPLIEMIQEAAPGTLIRRPLAGLGIGQQKAWLANQLRVQPAPQMPAP